MKDTSVYKILPFELMSNFV